jgi:hypothetical protein
MALVVKDRVQETTTTTGTGTVTLGGAVSGFQAFSVIGDGNTTYYAIYGGSEWEVGIGTYTASGTTLSRDTILESSNSGSAVDFSAGTKNVFVTYPAETALYLNGALLQVPASSGTWAERFSFQTNEVDADTYIQVIPNGEANNGAIRVFDSPDPDNSSWVGIRNSGGDDFVEFFSGGRGTGEGRDIVIKPDDNPVAYFTTDGNVLIGTNTNSGGHKLLVDSGIVKADNYDIGLTTEGSDTVALDFSGGTGLSTRSAAGTVTFTASNYRAGAIKTVRVIAGGSSRTLTFPNDWVFVGAKPASIASGKTGILTVTSFGTTEANCVAAWAVQT